MHAPVGLAKCSGIQTITIGLISIVSVFLEHPVQSISKNFTLCLFNLNYLQAILSLQSISGDVADYVNHLRWLDPTMELITYAIVLYLQHSRHDVKCKPSILLI